MRNVHAWAREEFGDAQLGDQRRGQRLVGLAAEVAKHPAGQVTKACESSASREGAFRFLENEAIHVDRLVEAMQRATARRCRKQQLVYVPVDATSLTLADDAGRRELGAVGSWKQGSRGVHVMTGLAVSLDGTPLGICGQQMWVRERRSRTRAKAVSSAISRETRFWLEVIRSSHEAFEKQAPDCKPFYQLDRGADCWPVLKLANELGVLLTVRAAHDRKVDAATGQLWASVEQAPVRFDYSIEVPARTGIRKRRRQKNRRLHWREDRPARRARLQVRATEVALILGPDRQAVSFNAVLVREDKPRSDRIEWLLVTSHPIRTRADLRRIIAGYSCRWRIEEFHRTWKRGLCRVEDTQLRKRQAIFKWATILASVASRAVHLCYLARQQPDLPALTEMNRTELNALIALRQPRDVKLGDQPTLAQAVRWLADIGGYTGPWRGPPGPTVIGRGLHDVLIAARAMQNLSKLR
jgi:hypothetical protein